MTLVTIIRHGETEWNRVGRYQGQNDSPLTERGIRQAKAISERLSHQHFDLMVSSDLGRAVDTARIIAEPHPTLKRERDERLRERDFGMLTALTRVEALEKHPVEEEGYLTGGPHYRIPGGESLHDVYERCGIALSDWATKCGEGHLLIVTHGGVLGQFLRYVLGVPLEMKRAYKFVNCAYNHFSFHPEEVSVQDPSTLNKDEQKASGRWLLHTWGDETHLAKIGADDDI